MFTEPFASHITWTTDGTWLHGDERGWVEQDVPGVQGPNLGREAMARKRMTQPGVVLTEEQRELVGRTIRGHCRIRGWTLHAVNVRTNHVHLVVTAGRTPEEVMNQLMAWTSRRLSDQAGLTQAVAKKVGRRRWWTEHGSTKWIFDEDYLQNATRSVTELQ